MKPGYYWVLDPNYPETGWVVGEVAPRYAGSDLLVVFVIGSEIDSEIGAWVFGPRIEPPEVPKS